MRKHGRQQKKGTKLQYSRGYSDASDGGGTFARSFRFRDAFSRKKVRDEKSGKHENSSNGNIILPQGYITTRLVSGAPSCPLSSNNMHLFSLRVAGKPHGGEHFPQVIEQRHIVKLS